MIKLYTTCSDRSLQLPELLPDDLIPASHQAVSAAFLVSSAYNFDLDLF